MLVWHRLSWFDLDFYFIERRTSSLLSSPPLFSFPLPAFTQIGREPHLGPLLQTTARDRMALNKAIATLSSYSLICRDATQKTLSIHRLVQAVLRDVMDEQNQRQWAKRTVYAI